MRAFKALLSTLLLCLFTLSAQAGTAQYEIYHPVHGSTVPFPNLDLNGVETIKVHTSNSIHDPMENIDYLELVFKNATNLVAKNFKKEDDSYSGSQVYRAVVQDAWVYSKVIVKVTTDGPISGGKNLFIELEVAELTYELNDPVYSHGVVIFNADGILSDVTPTVVADVETVTHQNDELSLTLHQKPKFDEFTGEGFKIKANWMGHGERTLTIPAPFSSEEYSFFRAAGIEVQSETFPDGFVEHQFRIKYEDAFGGYTQYTPFESLNMYIDQAYQATP
ncbi:hypothetical protein [Kangiella marina]|uniref:Peptidase n=1 Tax=Kangiella marina TaxID=1079178 RepID=A0ABP8IGG7_9GAMM